MSIENGTSKITPFIKPYVIEGVFDGITNPFDYEAALGAILGVCRAKGVLPPNRLVEPLMKGHTSMLESMQFVFWCEGWGRDMLLELERHRIGTGMQVESTRYVDYSEFEYTIPEGMTPEQVDAFKVAMESARFNYIRLSNMGIPRDKRRGIIPGGAHTRFFWWGNTRAIEHLIGLRCAPDAHWEIKDFSWGIWNQVKPMFPVSHPLLNKWDKLINTGQVA